MRKSRAASGLALLAGAALLLSACGGGGTGNGGSDGSPQNLNPGQIGGADQVFKRPTVSDIGDVAVAVEENFHNYNNYTGAANNISSVYVLNQVLPSAFVVDVVDGKQIIKLDGDLMDSVTVKSKDPMVVEWKVRKEAVWSDGQPIDGKDFYLRWLAATSKVKVGTSTSTGDPGSGFDSSPSGYDQISKVELADGNKTITTTFSKPYADYRSLFSRFGANGFLPAHILEAKTGIPDITKVTDADQPSVDKAAKFWTEGWKGFTKDVAVSGGPYLIDSADLKDQTVLVRNPKYFGAKGGPAKLTIRTNSDSQAAIQQLQNKEVQVAAPQAESAVVQAVRNDGSLKAFVDSGLTYEHIDLNMSRPLFKDIAVRKAIFQCVPRQSLIDNLVKDVNPNAKPLGSFMFMPNEQGYQDHYSDLGNGDVAAAKKTLEDAGYKQGTDGVYAKGDQKVSFKLGHKVVPRRADTVRLVQAKCKEAGIDIQDDQASNFNDKRLPASEFDAALFAWVGNPTKSSAFGNYATKSAGGTSNYNNYSNPEVDKEYADANGELDFQKRVDMLNDVDKKMHDDYHSLPLFQLPDFAATNAGFGPVSYVGFAGGVTWNAEVWQKN
ncbi:ABC transporter family substrate-binding protein [Solihabitans fulvus]|uniref:ABC transporter family substrate-binding protein n=1 Tax=Solihabitans fulvus TaxID=1892852 RepID=A0A5B2XD36_9PSEU|nr:ABC transporter family substrate-binding protein [Solihabitans fulvus]KAA2261577.1 ABC transporter family substrate-binding protein [Solihabitans fulvus]